MITLVIREDDNGFIKGIKCCLQTSQKLTLSTLRKRLISVFCSSYWTWFIGLILTNTTKGFYIFKLRPNGWGDNSCGQSQKHMEYVFFWLSSFTKTKIKKNNNILSFFIIDFKHLLTKYVIYSGFDFYIQYV